MSPNQRTSTDIWSALGDARRRRILELLAVKERSVGELTADLQITQASVSQHLVVLRGVGLIETTSRGTSSINRLAREPLAEVTEWIAGL